VGVEPTIHPAKGRIAGFEGREDHRTPCASVCWGSNDITWVSRLQRCAGLRHDSNTRRSLRELNFVGIGSAPMIQHFEILDFLLPHDAALSHRRKPSPRWYTGKPEIGVRPREFDGNTSSLTIHRV
jgi:hypothetical protein